MSAPELMVTVPPEADFLPELARAPGVTALRLNTVMPLSETPEAALRRLRALGLPLWIDLKGRQLRVAQAALPPYTAVQLNHRIRVATPTWALFADGQEAVRVLAVADGDRLLLEDGPRRFVGPGESVNIPDPTLEVEGGLTGLDREYLRAAANLGLEEIMLSFVERPEDVEEVLALHPRARVLAKIESERGLSLVRREPAALRQAGAAGLVAARGDLFCELHEPSQLPSAVADVLAADPGAVVASRILESLAHHPDPSAADLGDLAHLLLLGYGRFMLGDAVCLRRETVLWAVEVFNTVTHSRRRRVPRAEPDPCVVTS